MTRNRRGFTMIELVVVVVLGSLILGATLQVLLTNQRIYTGLNSRVRGSQSMRAALAVLSSELREISPPEGDLVMMDVDQLRIRAMRQLAVICHDTVRGETNFRALQFGDPIAAGDSVVVFADNNSLRSWDDEWILTRVTSVAATTCYGAAGQRLTFASATPFTDDSVSSGAEVRAFTHVAYRLVQEGSEWFLGQSVSGVSGGAWQPVVGPLRSSRGLEFRYLDESESVTTIATEVAMIDVTVRTGGDVVGSTGQLIADSVTVRIHTRN